MITEKQFIEYINNLSDEYEAIKDEIYSTIGPIEGDKLIGLVVKFRDTACTALRASHVNKNFNNN
jgi:hypothetical protein